MKIIKNGILVTPDGEKKADIGFELGRILKIGGLKPTEYDEVYDAAGCYVFPGFIDQHTHLQMNTGTVWTADDFESGTRAAVAGGTTCIVDFATQERGDSLKHAFGIWMKNAQGSSRCNYAFHMAVTDWNEDTEAEIGDMIKAGVCSFKVYMAYDNLRLEDAELLKVLKRLAADNAVCGCHCENGPLIAELQKEEIKAGHTGPGAHPLSRPAEAEAEAVNRFAYLGELAGAPIYVVHLSSELGLEEVRAARRRGQTVYAETCPQYLLLDDSRYDGADREKSLTGENFEGAKYVMSPPLRKPSDVKALRDAVIAGEIDAVATDHCSFRFDTQKVLGRNDFRKIPNGAPGIEHRPALMMTSFAESLSMTELNRLLSEGPARLMGMYPRKGALIEGSDADITVWDPEVKWTIRAEKQQQNVDYTPYEGMEMHGQAAMVFVNGELAAQYGSPLDGICGCYVARSRKV